MAGFGIRQTVTRPRAWLEAARGNRASGVMWVRVCVRFLVFAFVDLDEHTFTVNTLCR
jgi:hypothetical protein